MSRLSHRDLDDRIVDLELKLHNVVAVGGYRYNDGLISLYLWEVDSGKSYTLDVSWEEIENLDVIVETIRLQALF